MKEYRIVGLDSESGLKNVNYQEDVYDMVLETYCEEATGKIELYRQADEAFIKENLQKTIIDMHGIKGSSNGIGALELGEKFRKMEFAGKDGNIAFLLENMESCMNDYQDLVEQIQIFFSGSADSGTKTVGEEQILDLSLIDKLIQALDDIDFDIFEEGMTKLLEQNFGADINRSLNEAWHFYDNFDYEETADVLKKLKG